MESLGGIPAKLFHFSLSARQQQLVQKRNCRNSLSFVQTKKRVMDTLINFSNYFNQTALFHFRSSLSAVVASRASEELAKGKIRRSTNDGISQDLSRSMF